jgi:hypothetical protein
VVVLVICILYSEVFLNLTEVFLTLTEVLPCLCLSCKANVRVKLAKTGHGPHSSTLIVICVVRLLLVLLYVSFVCKCVLPPGDNSIAVNKYIILLVFSVGFCCLNIALVSFVVGAEKYVDFSGICQKTCFVNS